MTPLLLYYCFKPEISHVSFFILITIFIKILFSCFFCPECKQIYRELGLYQKKFSNKQFLGNLVAVNRIQYKQSLRSTLSEVITVFKGLSDSRLVAGSENYIIPVLMLWAVKYREAEDLLDEWSSFAEQPLPSVLARSFHVKFNF